MSRCNHVLAIDAGGSYFKSCIVDHKGVILKESHYKTPVNSSGTAENIFLAYENIKDVAYNYARKVGITIDGIGISTPGPFDYAHYISFMTHKFQGIYGINLKEALCKRFGFPISFPINFIHDAHAFIMGEYWNGAAKGYSTAAGITIGTGLGFGLVKEGEILDNGSGGPYVSIFKMLFGDEILEDFVSRRGIMRTYRRLSGSDSTLDVIDIGHLARVGDMHACNTFLRVGKTLGKCLRQTITELEIECLVFGGQISKGFDLMEAGLKEELAGARCLKRIAKGNNLDDSALIGAAYAVFGGL